MRLLLLFSISALAALALQTGGLHWLAIGTLMPDLIIILTVELGLRHHTVPAALLAFAMGYATDVFSGSQLGLNAFLITLVFLLSYEASRHLWVTNDLVGSITVFFAVLLKTFLALFLTGNLPGFLHADAATVRMALLQALLTAIVAPVVFMMLSGGKRLLGLPERTTQE